jgi:hypothetical protein
LAKSNSIKSRGMLTLLPQGKAELLPETG